MSRILAIKGADSETKIDYSSLSLKEIQKRIKGYEKSYGSFTKFLRGYDCGYSPPEDYITLIDWECLLNEIKSRKSTRLSLIRGGKRKPR
ncbi:MAG: hypothetical protein A2038_14585 [Deltaproteobacteria bacterium GWA2_57_13]|nr:MAG: hypothetical protein A2038_14585 [Deltaproteobacteria bacterium GWA2_57_13]OGQ51458.1 MAG: hypothetical protein A3I10_03720 [Deltaproteobacteria bacterium RIFCSPLOWO2_02_FULL_57_26]OGQ85059.1 MAG: hypothetical protein A3G40_08775 [Deltaproteobacteria bacterium RIFCSPLOWO2_12_FULL_57_22]